MKITSSMIRESIAVGICMLMLGCATLDKPAGAGFASVLIGGHTPQEISDATMAVFEKADYLGSQVDDGLVFERDGLEWMQLAYGSNISGGRDVTERVKAQIIDQGGGIFRLQCTAYIVQPRPSGEHEIRLRLPRSGPYRDWLKQVASKFSPVQVVNGKSVAREENGTDK